MRHSHAYVLPCFLEIGSGGFQIQLPSFDAIADPQTLEDRDGSAKRKPCAGCVSVGISVIGGKASAEGEILAGASADHRQAATFGCFQSDLLLLDLEFRLLEGNVVLLGMTHTFSQGPWPGMCLAGGCQCGEQ